MTTAVAGHIEGDLFQSNDVLFKEHQGLSWYCWLHVIMVTLWGQKLEYGLHSIYIVIHDEVSGVSVRCSRVNLFPYKQAFTANAGRLCIHCMKPVEACSAPASVRSKSALCFHFTAS